MSSFSYPPTGPNGYQKVTVHPPEESGTTEYTFNWCDPTTWYQQSTRVVNQQLDAVVAGSTYKVPSWDSKWAIVDSYHGKITNEDYLLDADGHSYRVEVKVDDAVKVERDPHVGSGGDFTVNYSDGTVNFPSSIPTGSVVTMTYHKVDRSAGDGSASLWKLTPKPGKALEIVKVEVQFSSDVALTDSIKFQAFAGPYPVGNPDVYKTMWDFYNDANGAYPSLPALGGASWRGANVIVYSFPWLYQAVKRIPSSNSVEIRVWLDHDIPLGGTNATATFYCLSVDE